jgi:hypothetical protein
VEQDGPRLPSGLRGLRAEVGAGRGAESLSVSVRGAEGTQRGEDL